jgi:1-acyl-sn-glycerol-3-phosphate acyltransferase
MINRIDRRSQLECLKQCGELLKRSAPVLFFPEGTRSKTRYRGLLINVGCLATAYLAAPLACYRAESQSGTVQWL